MKKTVKGGPVLKTAEKIINKIFDGLDRCLDDLKDKGVELKDSKDIEDGELKGKTLWYVTSADVDIFVDLWTRPDQPDKYLLVIYQDEHKDEEHPNKLFKKEEISDYILEYASEHDLISMEPGVDGLKEAVDVNDNVGMNDDEVFQSTKISVTLKRVSSSAEIHLCAINAGSNPHVALKLLNEVLDDDEFTSTITEEPVSFDILPNDNEIEITETDSVSTSDTFSSMLKAATECYHNIETIHWGAKTNKFNEIHSFTENLLWSIRYNIDNIAEWCVEYTKVVPNVLSFEYDVLECPDGFDFDCAMSAAKTLLDKYICILETYYVNVEHDVQSVMDNWIREYKKQSNYFLDRSLMKSICDAVDPVIRM